MDNTDVVWADAGGGVSEVTNGTLTMRMTTVAPSTCEYEVDLSDGTSFDNATAEIVIAPTGQNVTLVRTISGTCFSSAQLATGGLTSLDDASGNPIQMD